MVNSVSVQPLASPQYLQKRQSSFVSKIKNKASDSWLRSQIGHRSEYSVERLLSFRDYYQRTSLARAITVCILTPLPALAAALAIDCIPLESPSQGWRANYATWMRLFITMFTISLGLIAQMKEVITRGTITNMGAVKVALGTATTYVAASITLAAVWRFPIPFGLVLMVSPYVWIFSFYTVMVIGPRVLVGSPVLRQQILYQLLIVSTQGIVAVAYPLFSAVFDMLTGPEQTAFVLVMSLIKFFTKQIIARAAQSLHEYVGPIVVFSVDVYNVFYVAICMQAATFTWTTLVIFTSDSFHVIVALRSIFQQTNSVQKATTHFLQDLPAMVQSVLLDAKARSRRIRVSAPFPLPLSPENGAILNKLKQGAETSEQNAIQSTTTVSGGSSVASPRQGVTPIQVIASNPTKPFIPTTTLANNRQITPIGHEPEDQPTGVHLAKTAWKSIQKMTSKGDEITLGKKVTDRASEKTVKEALQTLFHAEYVLMAEYIEFMLPMLYSVYLLALYHLPVAKYYPHTVSMTTNKLGGTVASIMLYAMIEFVAFAALLVLLRRKFGFSPLYQLAFVLETNAHTLQGYLFVWTPFILHLTLAHYVAKDLQVKNNQTSTVQYLSMASTRQVQPTDSLGDQSRYGRYSVKQDALFHFFGAYYNRVALSWHRLQIGNRASYSVERVLAFRDYCERTSPVRAFAVCILTPVPATTVTLLIESIPLRPPEEGWRANYAMWIRVLVTAFFVGGGIVFLATAIISEARISTIRALCITMVSAVCYTALGVFLAAVWKYPIPFGMVIMVCPFVTVIFASILLSINPQELKTKTKLQKQVVGHAIGASAQSLLVVAYPTFSAVFLQLSGVQQAIFMLVLPVIKFSTKQIIAQVATHLGDYIGAVVVFTVDIFNVLYVAICMQTARSSLTTMLIMSSDILHILVSLRTIYYHTHANLEQPEQQKENLSYVDKIISSLTGLKPRARPNSRPIRLHGPYKLPFSAPSEAFLESLNDQWNVHQGVSSTRETAMKDQSIPSSSAPIRGPSHQLVPLHLTKPNSIQESGIAAGRRVTPIQAGNSVVPQERILLTSSRSKRIIKTSGALKLSNSQRSTRRGVGANPARAKLEKTIQQELQVLFHCEYVILSEYVEFVLPLVYAGYLAGLYRLPTAAYYPFTRSLTPSKMKSTLIQLVIYSSLEFASFVGLYFLLKKRLGYSPAYQLAFVLETHAVTIQSLLFIWVPFIVQLTLVHVGTKEKQTGCSPSSCTLTLCT